VPILFLFGLGAWIRPQPVFGGATVDDLKKIAVYLDLPACCSPPILKVELQPRLLVTIVLVFGLCVALYGWVCRRPAWPVGSIPLPFLMTGFEYGMLGVSSSARPTVWRTSGAIAIIDLGHEITSGSSFWPCS
jgi:hypothetical protein